MQLRIFDNRKQDLINNQTINDFDVIDKIEGLKYIPNFISQSEHEKLWRSINKETWITDLRRRVQHYGWKYDYKARAIDYSMYLGELPDWAQTIAKKLSNERFLHSKPDQLIINEYKPGQGISNHVDCEPCFGNTIVTISLGSKCIMDFKNLKTNEKVEVLLEPRSLAVISNNARYKWSHGIAARKTDKFKNFKIRRQLRISMTFRNVILNE